MKHLLGTLVLYLATIMVFGQKDIEIVYNQDFTATLNGTSINNETTYQEIVDMLGEPEVYKEYPTGKINYRYTDLGLVIHTVNDNLLFIGVNYNWDGDKSFPSTTFEGDLKIGDTAINKETSEGVIDELDGFEIKCIIPGMCMNNPNEIKNPIIVGFKDGLVTQVGIEFH